MTFARGFLWSSMLMLVACKYNPVVTRGFQGATSEYVGGMAEHTENLSVLSITGGLCLAAGMVLLVVTSGRKGWYPVIGGLLLVVLNYAVARYSDFLFYPLVVCTGMISAAWTYKTVREILLEKKTR